MNWTVRNIFDGRAKLLHTTDGDFYIGTGSGGWTLYTSDYKRTKFEDMDVLEILRWLNDHKAEIVGG